MIGHQQIIEYRREGLKPSAIYLEVGFDTTPARYRFEEPEQALEHGFYPTVSEVTPADDLRFCVGCQVHVHGKVWTDEVMTIAEKVAEAGAEMVVVCCINDNSDLLIYKNGEWEAHAGSN